MTFLPQDPLDGFQFRCAEMPGSTLWNRVLSVGSFMPAAFIAPLKDQCPVLPFIAVAGGLRSTVNIGNAPLQFLKAYGGCQLLIRLIPQLNPTEFSVGFLIQREIIAPGGVG